MRAVAVSFTDLTDVAPLLTAIWACRTAGRLVVTDLMMHEAVPSPLVQPLVKVAFWLVGSVLSVMET